jgi:2-C-methyl-D-erythritol 4-phosphate cytidylyltransferase/2-C-methyl-D-erythritol 2,4-cyclodiphosphate synthase
MLAFLEHPRVDAVGAIIHPDDGELYAAASEGLQLLEPVNGGASRQKSARLGLESLAERRPDQVLIHDAARPFVDEGVISRVVKALKTAPAAIPALPVNDTLKRGQAGRIVATVGRADLWRAQTPQGFRFREILAAHRRYEGADLTDDAAVAERAGLAVELVAGSEDNVKITTEDDWRRAQQWLGGGTVRTGIGFDAHRYGPGEEVMLCGVSIPHHAALVGHSDADVGLHALTDALLGAIAAGDIGGHFPADDPEWRDAPSEVFLKKAGELIRERDGAIANVDVTLICEAPKIAPHRAAMVRRIAEILDLAEDRVSVKATTTEQMGFTGRGEGIAAQAITALSFAPGKH